MALRDVLFTAGDFQAWLDHPVTKSMLEDIINLINAESADLIMNAGQNQIADRYKSGKIAGLAWVADWQPELKEVDE